MKVVKTIQMETVRLDPEQIELLDKMYCAWTIVYNGLSRFVCAHKRCRCSFIDVRNEVAWHPSLLKEMANAVRRETGLLKEGEPLPRWFWTMAVHSLAANINSHRSNQINRIKYGLFSITSPDEYGALCYLLECDSFLTRLISSARAELPKIKNKEVKKKLESFDPKKLHSCLAFIRRRLIQLDTFCITRKSSWMRLDKCGFQCFEENGKFMIRIPPFSKSGKEIRIELHAPFYTSKKGRPSSTVTLVFDRNKKVLKVQRAIKLNVKKIKRENPRVAAADIGINCPIASSDGKVFNARQAGRTYKDLLISSSNKERDDLKRKQVQESKAALQDKLTLVDLAMAQGTRDEALSSHFEESAWRHRRKANNIRKHNTGMKRFNRRRKKEGARMENLLNINTRDFLDSLDPEADLICLEALDIRKPKFDRKTNHMLSFWHRGFLKERIEYKASLRAIKTEDVNPSYSSQYCCVCGSLIVRGMKDKTVGFCPVCKEIHADINAARNLLWVYYNPNIQVYTRQPKVKEEYEKRHAEWNSLRLKKDSQGEDRR